MRAFGAALPFIMVALAASAQEAAPALTPSDVAQFVDAAWRDRGDKSQTPGMEIAVVHDGEVLFLKGYGVAKRGSEIAVDPERTQFRIGSVSKIFVGLAAAKAIARGDVSPGADINTYLKTFAVPDAGYGPLTLHHLLTHSGGLDEKYFADSTFDRAKRVSLAEHLRTRLPARIRKPGEIIAYSNYGYSLAALVLEEATGTGFADLVERDVLAPAGMSRSGYDAIDRGGASLATGYGNLHDELVERPYTWLHRYPSTSMITTAGDMARLMLALTDASRSACLLDAKARALSFEQQMTHDRRLPGRTYGFAEWRRNRTPGIWHDGATAGFSAQFILLPAERFGLFVVVNNQSGGLDSDVFRAVLDRYFPKANGPAPAAYVPNDDMRSFAGDYVSTRRSVGGIEKIESALTPPVEIAATKSGRLRFNQRDYVRVAPDAFEAEDGSGRTLVFRRDAAGAVTHLFLDWGGDPRALVPQPWSESKAGASRILGLAGILLLLPIVSWPIVFWIRRESARRLGALYALAGLLLLGAVGFVVAFALTLDGIDPLAFRAGEAGPLLAVLAIPPVLGALAVLLGLQVLLGGASPCRG